jgi:hypothetical protein
MKFVSISVLLLLNFLFLEGQNLVGYSGKDIQRYMKENRRNMNLESVTNSKFKYLKYSDNYDDQTLLFFLNSDSLCVSIRHTFSKSMKSEKVKEFNSIYKINGVNSWIDHRDGKEYKIKLKDGEWSFSVIIEPENNL